MSDRTELRVSLGGVRCDAIDDDNLAIFLASYFEDGVGELNDWGWTDGAIAKTDEALDAIHAHYEPSLTALRLELQTARAERDAARAQVKTAWIAGRDAAADECDMCPDQHWGPWLANRARKLTPPEETTP